LNTNADAVDDAEAATRHARSTHLVIARPCDAIDSVGCLRCAKKKNAARAHVLDSNKKTSERLALCEAEKLAALDGWIGRSGIQGRHGYKRIRKCWSRAARFFS
jgi:hypothetical protein